MKTSNSGAIKRKARYFTFLLYPDSTPTDWRIKLETLDVPIAISSLHDQDPSKMGGFKKPHWHIIYIANNPVTAEAIRVKIKRLLGDNSLAKVQIIDKKDIQKTYLYLTHESKDTIAKHKHIYPKSEIQCLNGFDVDQYIVMDASKKKALRRTLLTIIKKHHLVNLLDLKGFINEFGDEYDPELKRSFTELVTGMTSILRLYFDANYQNGFRSTYCDTNEQKA